MKRGRPRKYSAPRRNTTVDLPEAIYDELTLLRLSSKADGRRFVQNDWLNDAVSSLPDTPSVLLRQLEGHAGRLNVGLVARDPGYTPTRPVTIRLTPEADAHLDRITLECFRRERVRITRQDLISLAVLLALG